MKRLCGLVATGLCLFALWTGGCLKRAGEAGSEAGSAAAGSAVAGSAVEAGSAVVPVLPLPEAGSTTIEAGSSVVPPLRPPKTPRRAGRKREAFGGGTTVPAATETTEDRLLTVWRVVRGTLVALVALAAVYCLLRVGSRKPYAGELWRRRANLCAEIAQQMDVLLVAAYREEWETCDEALAALNDRNGQRLLLLDDFANRSVLDFMAVALDCRLLRDDPDFLPELRSRQLVALQAMRRLIGQNGGFSSPLTMTFRETRNLYRPLRNPGERPAD